jgi:fatty acid desaturase
MRGCEPQFGPDLEWIEEKAGERWLWMMLSTSAMAAGCVMLSVRYPALAFVFGVVVTPLLCLAMIGFRGVTRRTKRTHVRPLLPCGILPILSITFTPVHLEHLEDGQQVLTMPHAAITFRPPATKILH